MEWQRRLIVLVLASCIWLLVIQTNVPTPGAGELGAIAATSEPGAIAYLEKIAAKPHPLPPTLEEWEDHTNSGDYFSAVKPVEVGHLVFTEFPVKVYVEHYGTDQAPKWVGAVLQAVQEWGVYLPLEVVEEPEIADIAIWHRRPPLQFSATGDRPRARSAETRYEVHIRRGETSEAILSHRCSILLSPSQTGQYVKAAARHELGHALGIWGHSMLETDTMYSSQVRNPPQISSRDVNTLKRVYEQPTRLGWPLP